MVDRDSKKFPSLAHLNYYYAMARANHYNILATGIVQSSLLIAGLAGP